MTIRLTSQVYVGQFYGPANLLHVLTIYSRKVVLGMIDQCHSDIVNYILVYIIVINFKIFYN